QPPPAPWAYSKYQPKIYSGFSPFGYPPFGFGAIPYGNLNWLPPNPPSPYYVTPSGKEYLQQARRREQATCNEIRLQHYLQKEDKVVPQRFSRRKAGGFASVDLKSFGILPHQAQQDEGGESFEVG